MTNHDTDGMNPTALAPEQAARLLGTKVDVIRRHIADGLPTGSGGTVNLLTYAAWLNANGASHEGEA